jgi:hypothetical protein
MGRSRLVGKQEVIYISQGHLCSVHQIRLHHGFHHLILSDQLVAIYDVRVDVQSGADIGMAEHGLHCLDVALGLGDQVVRQGMAEIVEAKTTPIFCREYPCLDRCRT